MQIRKALWKFRIKAGKVLYTALKRVSEDKTGEEKTAGAQERTRKPPPRLTLQRLCVNFA